MLRRIQLWSLLVVSTFAIQQTTLLLANENPAKTDDKAASSGTKVDEATEENEEDDGIPAGHSIHGEAFNEGARQAAYLMDGMGKIKFPATSEKPDVGKFVVQGVAQLHGFWNFEAERSFRQAAAIDPDCAIAYWGMAMSNLHNYDRAKSFIDEAVKRRDKAGEHEQMYIDALKGFLASKDSGKRASRSEAYMRNLEKIIYKYPDDIEAKAFLALQLWKHRSQGGKILSYFAVSALQEDIFKANPMHPAHHYRIHLWDGEKPEQALRSSALCGQSSPGIAHMWHMPGHIYSRLKRYNDAAWQQEASARVDHAHMMRDLVIPDQISNFAHNNEWCIRNMSHAGRVTDAVALAKNMIELPRHPKYNTLDKRHSANYGRRRLFEVLERYELWEQTIELCNSNYLEPTEKEDEQIKRLRHLGTAYARSQNEAKAREALADLNDRKSTLTKERDKKVADAEKAAIEKAIDKKAIDKAAKEAVAKLRKEIEKEEADKAKQATEQQPVDGDASKEAEAETTEETAEEETPESQESDSASADKDSANANEKEAEAPTAEERIAKREQETRDRVRSEQIKKKKKDIDRAKSSAKRPYDTKLRNVDKAINAIDGFLLIEAGQVKEGLELVNKAGGVTDTVKAAYRYEIAENDKDKDAALESARKYVSSHKNEIPPLARLTMLLWEADKKDEAKERFNELRELSSPIQLGSPLFDRLTATVEKMGFDKDWVVRKGHAEDVGTRPELDSLGPLRWQPSMAPSWTLKDDQGKERSLKDYEGKSVVVIFYLGFGCLHCAEQLQSFAPKAEEFRKQGIELIAISSDDEKALKQSVEEYDKGRMPFPLVTDSALDIFKTYRVHDDFENTPLHGTFLIDGKGRIRWQDIGYEPFNNPDFVLKEAQRLLGQGS